LLKILANHNEDLARLVEKGFALAIDRNCLVVRDIPYLDEQKQLRWGAIIAKLVFENQVKVRPEDHQVLFAGSRPCGIDGTPVRGLGGGAVQFEMSSFCSDVVVQRSFSHKLKEHGTARPYSDNFEKINSYVTMISGPAMALFDVNPYSFRAYDEEVSTSVFKLRDTLTSRAEISDLSRLLESDVVAIIGLGGTGAYVLDYMAKTTVKEIRGFDQDQFYVHNTFRSPGYVNTEEGVELGQLKARVYQSRYESFRHGIKIKPLFIDESSGCELEGVTFAFVCVDKGSSRKRIFDLLISQKIPFIDVGMGLNRKPGPISGTVRMTYFPQNEAQGVRDKQYCPETDAPEDIYKANIQIAELNALNACLAVIRFKQLRGFYVGAESSVQHLLTLDNLSLGVI
jgi:ThiF family